MGLSEQDHRLIAAIQGGLPLTDRPYAEIAARLGVSEAVVIRRLSELLESGEIKRFGIVVRHQELGYTANAMVVWDVPDRRVAEVAGRLSAEACVTLCYERARCRPDWPYNLFSMIHGKRRDQVLARLDGLIEQLSLDDIPHRVLFSGRRFKQRGARYSRRH